MKRKILALLGALIAIMGGVSLALFTTPAHAAVCTTTLGHNCGPYSFSSGIPMSNGSDTYVGPQNVGSNSGTTATATATDPGNWNVLTSAQPLGYTGVQIYAATFQLTNDWNGNGWGSGDQDTPLSGLSSLVVNYDETSPHGTNDIYEFAPDIWTNYAGQLGGGSGDIMFWADTSPTRCNDNGLNASNIVGQVTISGQNWTVYRYGGVGAEIVLVLDGNSSTDPVDTNSCAQQASGTIDVGAGLNYLLSAGIVNESALSISQFNTGWEITSADNSTFTMNSYSITAVPNGNPTPTPTPTTTSPTPTPTPTTTTPTPTPTPTPTLPASTTIYGCVTGSARVLEHVFISAVNFQNFLAANGGKCPAGGFAVVNNG